MTSVLGEHPVFTPVSLDSLLLIPRPGVGGTEFHRIILRISDSSQTLTLPVQTTTLSLSLSHNCYWNILRCWRWYLLLLLWSLPLCHTLWHSSSARLQTATELTVPDWSRPRRAQWWDCTAHCWPVPGLPPPLTDWKTEQHFLSHHRAQSTPQQAAQHLGETRRKVVGIFHQLTRKMDQQDLNLPIRADLYLKHSTL